jgi:hypothetical protein
VPARRVVVETQAARTPAIPTQQVGGHAALVDKDILPCVVDRERVLPVPTLRRDVRPSLFVGVDGFF